MAARVLAADAAPAVVVEALAELHFLLTCRVPRFSPPAAQAIEAWAIRAWPGESAEETENLFLLLVNTDTGPARALFERLAAGNGPFAAAGRDGLRELDGGNPGFSRRDT